MVVGDWLGLGRDAEVIARMELNVPMIDGYSRR